MCALRTFCRNGLFLHFEIDHLTLIEKFALFKGPIAVVDSVVLYLFFYFLIIWGENAKKSCVQKLLGTKPTEYTKEMYRFSTTNHSWASNSFLSFWLKNHRLFCGQEKNTKKFQCLNYQIFVRKFEPFGFKWEFIYWKFWMKTNADTFFESTNLNEWKN